MSQKQFRNEHMLEPILWTLRLTFRRTYKGQRFDNVNTAKHYHILCEGLRKVQGLSSTPS
jgi:hypothetical protein